MKTKQEMIQELHELYGRDNNAWSIETLSKHNENQICTLYAACLDENGVLRKPKST